MSAATYFSHGARFEDHERAKASPQRLTCTIDDAREVTGLGRTKLYELIGTGRIVTTTVGRRRLVVVRSLLALLDTNMSN
jgi:hypothetical protein